MIKIESIHFYNHKIFGTFDLDFKKEDGSIANNIVLAGENGSGKTKLLEEINLLKHTTFYFGNENNPSMKVVVNVETEGYYNKDNSNKKIKHIELIKFTNNNNYCTFIDEDGQKPYNISRTINGTEVSTNNFRIDSLFSQTDINYKPINQINGVTNMTVDSKNTDIPPDLAKDIIQLLIDISIQDAQDVQKWLRENPRNIVPENIVDNRMNRFTTAFQKIFQERLKFIEIKNNNSPVFKKNGEEVDIISLSSGEKQIVFRGVYLLKNIKSLKGITVLIDEPELSMHPIWEEKIFDYYKSIFMDTTLNQQTSQIFIATHSEHILKSALEDNETLIIKLRENRSNTKKFHKNCSSGILPTLTLSEIKWSIFDLPTIDFHIDLYGYIQSHKVTDANGARIIDPNIKQTDEYLERIIGTNQTLLKTWNYGNRIYLTLPSYIRNCIDHPSNISSVQPKYTEQELRTSIEFMISII